MGPQFLATMAVGSLALVACASTPGARPSEMSAMQHERMAAMEESQADAHASQFDPNARAADSRCGPHGGGCWTSVSNPSKEHMDQAEKHRRMAADHRAASQALRDAEARACTGLAADDRDMSPFAHREDIASVEPAYEHVSGKAPRDQMVGAVVTFRAVPGMTAEWLQRVADCHIARNDAMGNNMPEMGFCPLEPKGVHAKVFSAGNGFSMRIESSDPGTAQEVLRRSEALSH